MPDVETGPSSRIRFTNMKPPTFLIVQPNPCPFSLGMVIRFNPPVSLVLFRLTGSVSSAFNSLSLAVCTDLIQHSLSSSELQQKDNGFPSTIKLKQCFRFLVSNCCIASMSIKNIRPAAVLPRCSSSSFLKIHKSCLFKTTNRGRHCLRRLLFFCRKPSLMTRFFPFMTVSTSAMSLLLRAIYLIQTQENNAKNAIRFGNHAPEQIIYVEYSRAWTSRHLLQRLSAINNPTHFQYLGGSHDLLCSFVPFPF